MVNKDLITGLLMGFSMASLIDKVIYMIENVIIKIKLINQRKDEEDPQVKSKL